MPFNTFVRIAGIAGIIVAVCTIGVSFTIDQTTYAPNSPLYGLFAIASVVAGIVLAIGLYSLFRPTAAAPGLIAVIVFGLGNLLFLFTNFNASKPGDPIVVVADVLTNILGVALFSWLAYRTHILPRALAFVGWLAAASGAAMYAVSSAGASPTNPNNPLTNVMMVLYLAYFVLLLVWYAWTGIWLALGRVKLATTAA